MTVMAINGFRDQLNNSNLHNFLWKCDTINLPDWLCNSWWCPTYVGRTSVMWDYYFDEIYCWKICLCFVIVHVPLEGRYNTDNTKLWPHKKLFFDEIYCWKICLCFVIVRVPLRGRYNTDNTNLWPHVKLLFWWHLLLKNMFMFCYCTCSIRGEI